MDTEAAIQFWQKEVHYYEGRAGEQGASANRIVTVAVGATAILPLIANTINYTPTQNSIDVRLFLFAVPTVILLLWTSAVRLLHEMQLLRVYVRHAESRLRELASVEPELTTYQSWAAHGGKHDMPYVISLVWFIAALALSVAGTFGITLIIVGPAIGGAVWLAYGFLGVATVLLAYSFIDTSRDVKETERALGLDSDGDSHGSSTRMKLWVALITSALIFAPLGVTWLVASQPASTSPFGFVAAIFFIEAVLGAAVGWWAQNRVARHNARLAERVLITGALLGATLAGLAALLGIY